MLQLFSDYQSKSIKVPFNQLVVSTTKKQNGDDAIVIHLHSANSPKVEYVLKQIIHENELQQFKLIIDKTVSDIGRECGIPIPNSWLIHSNQDHPAKEYPNRAAILQTKVPGTTCEDNPIFDIQQCSREPSTAKLMESRYGFLHIDSTGLTLNVIQAMSHHSDLAKLCAFDTFINNPDRSPPNLFFDEDSNSYQGIDHFSAFFNYDLAKHAIFQLTELKDHCFSKQEIDGLTIYWETLKSLVKQFSPQDIYSLMVNNSKEIYQTETELSENIKSKLKYHEGVIITNCEDTKKLISYLENMILEQSKKFRITNH